ncbi:cystatin-A1-like [Notamacropus eugenii]|uniref:cystatin-A1-like n=1 Tax=Notamacropus eugenii TaxID=9315 RepID=UPI003B66C0E2
MMTGGLSETKPATRETQEIVDEVKSQFEEKSNEKYEHFEAVEYKSQVVAGIVYYVKVNLGNDRYAHLKMFKPLPHTHEPTKLMDYQTGKTKDDEVNYF